MPTIPYPSDLTDREWQVLAPLLPAAKPGGRPRTINLRRVRERHLLSAAWRLRLADGVPLFHQG